MQFNPILIQLISMHINNQKILSILKRQFYTSCKNEVHAHIKSEREKKVNKNTNKTSAEIVGTP